MSTNNMAASWRQANDVIAPGCFTDVVEHKITLTGDFKPKRLRAYRIPERLKPEVDRQIQEMLQLGIIRPSESPMAFIVSVCFER